MFFFVFLSNDSFMLIVKRLGLCVLCHPCLRCSTSLNVKCVLPVYSDFRIFIDLGKR